MNQDNYNLEDNELAIGGDGYNWEEEGWVFEDEGVVVESEEEAIGGEGYDWEKEGWVFETSGLSGAFDSTVDRLQAGYHQLMGDERNAQASLDAANAFRYEVESYKDIEDVASLGSFVAERLVQGLPMVPVLAAGPKGWAATAALASLEAGAVYAEQEEKNMLTAAASAGFNVLLEKAGLRGISGANLGVASRGASAVASKLASESLGVRGAATLVAEGSRSGAQHLVAQTVGYGKGFDDAMKDIDEAMVGAAIQRTAVSGPASLIPSKVVTEEPPPRINIEEDVLNQRSVIQQEAAMRGQELTFNEVWSANNTESKLNSLYKVLNADVPITAAALDYDTSDGKMYELLGVSKAAVKSAKLTSNIASVWDIPVIGKVYNRGDPVFASKEMNKFAVDERIRFRQQLTEFITTLDIPNKEKMIIRNDLKNYSSGVESVLRDDTKAILGRVDPLFKMADAAQEMLDINRMADAMEVKGASDIAAAGTTVADLMVTGGVGLGIGSALSVIGREGVNAGQKKINKRLKKLFKVGDIEAGGKKYSREDIQNVMDVLGKAGMFDEEVEEDYSLE